MLSNGDLCIDSGLRVPRERVEPLIQHEVGTHILTFQNGKAQPLKLFCNGVPGYEAMQEGLAVLAEFLAGGLTRTRLRLIAARAVGVHEMIAGRPFANTYALLHEEHGYSPRQAFTIAMRIYRGGGLTKDAVYLCGGLINLLKYLSGDHDLEELYIGKIREDYIPVVQELIHRHILEPPPLRPRYIVDPSFEFERKRARLKQGLNIFNLVPEGA